MRTIFYGVLNTTTNTKIITGVHHHKAKEKLAEMQKDNPKGNYKIIYKWASI